jgi:hypothetical protein
MRLPRLLAALLLVALQLLVAAAGGAASDAAAEKQPPPPSSKEGEGEEVPIASLPPNIFAAERNVSRVVANLTGTVAALGVHVPALHNMSSQLESDAGKVQAQVERMRGLDQKIKKIQNQARKKFHAKIKALAHEFYSELDAQTKPQRDTLSGLKQALEHRAGHLHKNAARASDVQQRVRRLKQTQRHGLERIENHMAEKNLVVLEVGNITFTYRNPSDAGPTEKQTRRLDAVWTNSKTPVAIQERRLWTHRRGAQSLHDVRVDSTQANSFINSGRSQTRGLVSTVQRRQLWGAVTEAVSSVCESCLETTERGVEATAAAAREVTREGTELLSEGAEATRETVEVPREVLAAAAAEAERLANEAIEYARDVATGAFDALSKAAEGLLGAAKEAYEWLGKLENGRA